MTQGEPYRPEMALWLELPAGRVIHVEIDDPGQPPVSFGESLRQAIKSPMSGSSRIPDRVRVESDALAQEVCRVLPGVEVVVAPTPEIRRVLERLQEMPPVDVEAAEPSYLEDGRVSAKAVGNLFTIAADLYDIAPWDLVEDDQQLRVDIPEYGIEGGCLSIIGALGESFGLLLFPSGAACAQFGRGAENRRPGAPLDLGGRVLALDFEERRNLPASMRREVKAHKWPLADSRIYPVVHHRERDGALRPLTEQDIKVITAVALGVVAFCQRHEAEMEAGGLELPVCESFTHALSDDVEVRLTLPYEAYQEFEIVPRSRGRGAEGSPSSSTGSPGFTPVRSEKVGRNDPCPCGSGKKYKRCCLLTRESASASPDDGAANDRGIKPSPLHDLDERLVARIATYAAGRFGPDWFRSAISHFFNQDPGALAGPWALHGHAIEGKTVAQWYAEEHGANLTLAESAWLEAQRSSWLSVWEVQDVDPGRSVTLLDLLTGERRVVQETLASRSLGPRDSVLARVVDCEGVSVFCGLYPRALPPREAASVVAQARGKLRRKSNVPIDRVRDPAIGRYLVSRTEAELERSDGAGKVRPALKNSDGDDLLMATDTYACRPADIPKIEQTLRRANDIVDDGRLARGGRGFTILRTVGGKRPVDGATVLGRIELEPGSMRVETNSLPRANAVRLRLESLLGPLVERLGRALDDPGEHIGASSGAAPPPTPPELVALVAQSKAKHYSTWIDTPLPALEGRTPREAVRSSLGRKLTDVLLKEMEWREARQPKGERFDFSEIRGQLGLGS